MISDAIAQIWFTINANTAHKIWGKTEVQVLSVHENLMLLRIQCSGLGSRKLIMKMEEYLWLHVQTKSAGTGLPLQKMNRYSVIPCRVSLNLWDPKSVPQWKVRLGRLGATAGVENIHSSII